MDIYKVHFEDGKLKEWAWNHGVKVQVVMNVLDDWSNFYGTFKYVRIRADYLLKSFCQPILILT